MRIVNRVYRCRLLLSVFYECFMFVLRMLVKVSGY